MGNLLIEISLILHILFSGLVKQTDSSLNVKLDTTYDAFNSGEQNLMFNGEYKSAYTGALARHNIALSINPTQFPHFNSDLTWETQVATDYIENMGKIRIGRRTWEITQQYSSQVGHHNYSMYIGYLHQTHLVIFTMT